MPNAGPTARAAAFPGAILLQRQRAEDGISTVDMNALESAIRDQLEVDSHLEPRGDTALLAANPGGGNTISAYAVNYSAGACRVGGVYERFASASDQNLIGGAEDIPSWALDGTAAPLLTADGQTYICHIVAVVVAGAVELHAVFGDEAADASEVEPSAQEINDALRAAGDAGSITDLEPECFLVLSTIKVQRVAVDTITMTHTDPATDDVLADERGRGYAFAAA